jgi:uracil-DNA glycosylase family 4
MNANPIANELLDLLQESREYTEYFAELGVETVALPTARVILAAESVSASAPEVEPRLAQVESLSPRSTARRKQSEPAPRSIAASITEPPSPPDSLFGDLAPEPSLIKSTESMEDVWRDIGDCTRCGLCEGRTQVVNTHGNHKARLMFVGEAPGADEDAQGKPFVGRAGQLLTKIIEAIGMKREEVLIGNVNRCRPPGNRQPTLEEAAICRPFLFREIAAVQPDVIVVMGNTALRNLLEVREGITRVRGQFQDFRGIKVMPTFHPAYLLRDPSKKRETWEDLKKVRDYLDGHPPGTTRP